MTELLINQPFGKIVINENGGFSNFQITGNVLVSRRTWILLLSVQNPVTSINELNTSGAIILSPNPASEYFQIEKIDGSFENVTVRIFSSDGKLVYQNMVTTDRFDINTSGWQKGVYFVHLLNGNENIVEKLVLER